MGGAEGIARQHAGGKLTVRERIERLADAGSWREYRSLVGSSTYGEDGELASFTPKGAVEGSCTLDGRKVIVSAGDFTVRGGSGGSDRGGLGMEPAINVRALESRLPFVRLLDAAGGSVKTALTTPVDLRSLPEGSYSAHIRITLNPLTAPVAPCRSGRVSFTVAK